jgi:hypothetical protein
MAVIDLYSKRKKQQAAQGKPDVYQYNEIPSPLRIQIVHIWRAALGRWYRNTGYSSGRESPSCASWEFIHDTIAKEEGIWHLGRGDQDPSERCIQHFIEAGTDSALDLIELSFRVIDRRIRTFASYQQADAYITQSADDAIGELNVRFREHGVGFQYGAGQILRVDSQFVHAQAVKPALELLNERGFEGPAEEFMRAFDHHRKGDNKESVAEALKAFESTMKSICAARKWAHPPNATAKPLMDILFKNGLVPPQMESHFSGLRAAMESGLPTIANPNRHGQGATPVEIPPHFATYALHLVASNIVFLVECHKAMK